MTNVRSDSDGSASRGIVKYVGSFGLVSESALSEAVVDLESFSGATRYG